ncbi:MAG: hypothetical protein ACYC7D_03110 [Nitrososphaerales archaeon]
MQATAVLNHPQKKQLHRGNELQRKAGISKYNKYFEEDVNLRRWYSNLERGSLYTADIYLRRLFAFCSKDGLTPEEFRALPKEEIENTAQDYVNGLEEFVRPDGKRYSPTYVESNLKAIKSWAEWNGKKITKKIGSQTTSRHRCAIFLCSVVNGSNCISQNLQSSEPVSMPPMLLEGFGQIRERGLHWSKCFSGLLL